MKELLKCSSRVRKFEFAKKCMQNIGIVPVLSDIYVENPDDACKNFDSSEVPFTTIISKCFFYQYKTFDLSFSNNFFFVILATGTRSALHPKKCPHVGRYSIINFIPNLERRRKRQQISE